MSNEITNRPRTLLAPQLDYILIDGSGSMSGKWWESLAALDAFMATLKAQNINSHAGLSPCPSLRSPRPSFLVRVS